MPIPVVDWRFGDKYYVTEFIMVNNSMIRDVYDKLKTSENDKFVENVADWIRDKFQYPLDSSGNPAAQAQLLMFRYSIFKYLFKKCVEYHWTFPSEVITSGYGICIDTANLAESVLRIKPIEDSWVVLGEVRDTLTDNLLGYHAWCELPYKNDRYVLETTIHVAGVNNLVKAEDIYNKKLDVYYVKHAYYNESEYHPVTSIGAYQIIYLLGLPAKKVKLAGFEKIASMKPKKVYKMWRKEEKLKLEAILNAFKK